jgi:hypothetical protein
VASQSVVVDPVANLIWQSQERRIGCIGNRAVRIKSVGSSMMCMVMIHTYMTLLAVGDFLRFNSLDGLLCSAIDPAAVAIVSDGAVVEDKSLVCRQEAELVMLVADGGTYINPGGLSQASKTASDPRYEAHVITCNIKALTWP